MTGKRLLFCVGMSVAVVVVMQLVLNFQVTVTTPNKINDDMSESSLLFPNNNNNKLQESKLSVATRKSTSSDLQSYDPARSPVFSSSADVKQFPLKVGIVTIDPLLGEAKHFLFDGVVQSDSLKLVHVVSLYPPVSNQTKDEEELFVKNLLYPPNQDDRVHVWIVDGARVAKLKRMFLDHLFQNQPNNNQQPPWKVLVIDFSDRFQFQLNKYHKHNIWKASHVRLAVRSIIQGRFYNDSGKNIVPGRIAPNLFTAGGPMLHTPYAVRSDIVQSLINMTTSISTTTDTAIVSKAIDGVNIDLALLWEAIERQERPLDVLHLWEISFKEGKSKLRNHVSQLVRSMNGTNGTMESTEVLTGESQTVRPIRTSIEEHGARRLEGRNAVDPAYIKSMLSSKIVIVTQKDDWEDHYRLMEALVCGPLVLADAMLAPPKGFVNGTNIIFFHSISHLLQLTLYYLQHGQERQQIAKNGWQMAMGRHRSWHRIEELLFGHPLTEASYRGS